MATCDRQLVITRIIEEVLGVKAEINKTFPWLRNKIKPELFVDYCNVIETIYIKLNGHTNYEKGGRSLSCDAYFGGEWKFIFEFDEFQHFSSQRLLTLKKLSRSIIIGL